MIFVYILFLRFLTINAIIGLNISLASRDCYRSPHSNLRIMVGSHFPTNPETIYLSVVLELFVDIDTAKPIELDGCYMFFKAGGECETNFKISSFVHPYQKMRLSFKVYHIYSVMYEPITEIDATFFYGLEDDKYRLIAKNKDFSFEIILKNFGEMGLPFESGDTFKKVLPFLTTLEYKGGDICIIIENEKPAILRPLFPMSLPNGYLSHLLVEHKYKNEYNAIGRYPIFECIADEHNPYSSLVIIGNGFDVRNFRFQVDYIDYTKSHYEEQSVELIVKDLEVKTVQNMDHIPEESIKLFLLENRKDRILCPDGTDRLVYSSKDGTQYTVKELRNVDVVPKMKQLLWILHQPGNPCSA